MIDNVTLLAEMDFQATEKLSTLSKCQIFTR